ncbi:proteinase-activated receptor 2-like [Myripristis murdjan]|uniref:Coagulation factor II (thrombin) receptor-like 1, tandem duplicate 2 n=1 Tax=Myripristis murdjan TaxID=586833 RepID=A0A667X3U3_9TELE|nr:proteinase-activated receptor 2-like [Myripristis murdjan]
MALTRLQGLLLLILYWINTSNAIPGKGRGFIGYKDPDSDKVVVDKATADALKSSLTTVFLPVIYIIVFVLGLPTNAMAIWVFLFRTKKKHPASIYMANLALSDLLFVIWTPLKIAYHFNGNNWIYGEGLCKVLVSFFYGNMYCSVLFITCLSVQRYWVVAHPLSQQRKNNKVAVIISVSIWAFIWLTATPLYLYNHTATIKDLNIITCHDVNAVNQTVKEKNLLAPAQDVHEDVFTDVQLLYYYFILTAVFVFLVPCIVIVVAYILLLRTLGNSMVDSTAAKNRQKAIVLIVTVLVTFLVCFIPSNIMLVVHYSLLRYGRHNNYYAFYITTLCLASLNSCLDPFIYYFVSEDFRNHVKNTLLCRSSRTVERMRVSFSSMKYSKKSKSYMSDTGNTESSTC